MRAQQFAPFTHPQQASPTVYPSRPQQGSPAMYSATQNGGGMTEMISAIMPIFILMMLMMMMRPMMSGMAS